MTTVQIRKTVGPARFEHLTFGALNSFRISCFRFRAFQPVLFVLTCFLCCAGCGDGKSSVTGSVTFDGQPVKNGTITFVKADGELVREGGVIQDGEFQATLPPGKYKIELNAQRLIRKQKQKGFDGKDEEVDITDELFPPRFNIGTELSEVIKPGSNALKFDLKSDR
jgi:hypothetical protein